MYWIHSIILPYFTEWNNMMNLYFPGKSGAVCLSKVKSTDLARRSIMSNVLLEVKGYRTPFPLFRGVHWVNILFRAYEGCQLN